MGQLQAGPQWEHWLPDPLGPMLLQASSSSVVLPQHCNTVPKFTCPPISPLSYAAPACLIFVQGSKDASKGPPYLSHTEASRLLEKNRDDITGCLPQFIAPCYTWHISTLVPLQPRSLVFIHQIFCIVPTHMSSSKMPHILPQELCCFLEHTTPALSVAVTPSLKVLLRNLP